MLPSPGLAAPAGAGIERRLVRRGIEQAGIVPETGLRAVAVMHVEIDHRDPRETVHLARPQRADRGVVEQAEPHRAAGLGMVPGRAHGAERVVGLARDDRIDRGGDRAGGAQRGLARTRRHDRVGVDPDMAGSRHRLQQALDKAARMDAGDVVDRGLGRLAPVEPGEIRAVERLEHRPQPGRRFRVVRAGVVFEAGGCV